MKIGKLKKRLALFLTAALTVGVVPIYPGNIENVKAAENGPEIDEFATKAQIMSEFEINGEYDGEYNTVGKIIFGKNEFGNAMEWYIVGKDSSVNGNKDNVILFATTAIKEKQPFEDEVYKESANDYSISDLRKALNEMVKEGTSYFTPAELGLMNDTKLENGSVTDKLYVLDAQTYGTELYAGGSNNQVVAINYAKGNDNGNPVWLRSPFMKAGMQDIVCASDGSSVIAGYLSSDYDVQPAFNLNLSKVLFASALPKIAAGSCGNLEYNAAMTLRLDGAGSPLGNAAYNSDTIIANKKDGAGDISLVVQGEDWYYSKSIEGTAVITAEDVKDGVLSNDVDLDEDVSFENCKVWLETTKEDGMIYANMAVKKDINTVSEVEVTDITAPVGGVAFDTKAKCNTEGIVSKEPIVYYTLKSSGELVTDAKASWNTMYIANVTLAADIANNKVFVDTSGDKLDVTINGEPANVVNHSDGTITVSYEFTTAKKKCTKIAAPVLPANNTFANYYTKDNVLTTTELGTTATVTFEDGINTGMPVTWTLIGDAYNEAPGAENQFQWTINSVEYKETYDLNNCSPTGTVTITNKSTTPVTVTGTDAAVNYTGATIDVSKYFTIGENAGEANYTLVTGEGAGTGEGTLAGTVLTVTKTGTFIIRLTTAANGVYGTATATVTLNVGEGVLESNATDYSGAYDGQPHGITVTVAEAEDAAITYSTDGTTYSTTSPQFTDAGIYTVHYKIEKPNHATVTGSKTVTIHPKEITITAADQNLVWGTDVDKSKYTVSEGVLAEGEQISQVTLTSSTTEFTDNGIIAANDAKIVNAEGKDVTANYNISYVNGKLVIKHNTILAPTELTVAKTTTTYTAGATLAVNDLTVKVTYPDGYIETVTDYKTNADSIDMTKAGDKTLTVSFTRNGKTITKDIRITVSPAPVIPTPVVKHKVTVNNGTGDGEYQAGQTVTITADTAPTGKQFKGWVIVSGGITLAGSTSATTTFKMPADTVEVTAAYEEVKTEEPEENTKKPAAKDETKKPTTTVEVEIPKTGVEITVPVVLAKGTTFVDAGNKATYKVMGDGSVEYVKPVNKKEKTVTIPATVVVNGVNCKVTGIADNAFKNNKKLTKVEIGDNVKNIGAGAFYDCKKLRTLSMGKNVTTIGTKAFSKCTALIDVTIPSQVSRIGSQAFSGCKKLKIIVIKTRKLNKKNVGSKAFKGVNKSIVFRVPSGKSREYGSFLKR